MLTRKSLFGFSGSDPTEFGRRFAAAALEHPVYFDEGLNLPVVLGSADIDTVLRDADTFSTRIFSHGLMKDALISTSGEEHTRTRKLYNSFFAPQKVRRYEETIVVPAAQAIVDDLAKVEQPDLIDHFCMLVPQRVVSALFGLPMERIADNDVFVRQMLTAIVRPFDEAAAAAGATAYAAMADELMAIAARELDEPSDTLFGEIAKALIAEGNASVEACERIVLTLILGSYETTIWMLASVVSALLHNEAALARVRADLSLLPNAIEEASRWVGSVIGTIRSVEREVSLGGETFAPGSVIHVGLPAPNYDAAIHPEPERFDIDRKAKPMIFGGGPHYCVGAPLARMEARVALSLLLTRFPGLRLDPERPAPVYSIGTRGSIVFGPDHLPVRLD